MLNSRNYAVLTVMLSAAGLLPMSAMANISFTEGGEQLINTLHTHLYSPPSSLSSPDKIKLAAVCFISDTSNCIEGQFGNTESGNGIIPDYDLNDAERCRKEGYTLTSCATGETPEGFCIYNSNYFARCVCPSGYKTCEPPYYGVGQACGNKYASCEEDTERACTELDSEFTDTCQSGWKVDPNNACEYDETYRKCCNLCEGYDYTTIPEGYIADGAACVDCNGTSKYKIKINPFVQEQIKQEVTALFVVASILRVYVKVLTTGVVAHVLVQVFTDIPVVAQLILVEMEQFVMEIIQSVLAQEDIIGMD